MVRAPQELRFAFLLLEEHPYGREMLARLLAGGFAPGLVISERSRVAELEREKFLERMAGFPIAPRVAEQLAGRDVARHHVRRHNGARCRQLLADYQPELLVLGGTRILRPAIFELAPAGALNAHPGLLPEVRGSASVAWAIALDEPVGCTCHFIEAGVDTGPIVGRRALPVRRGDTYEQLCYRATALSAALMREALEDFVAGTLTRAPQPPGSPAHKNMPPEQVEAVKRKLAAGRYRHLVA
ncbi:MAG: hypothetical protein H6713_34140 [Myxococcales bacterium]|nr:hypothetical protein [Myxococcales bacterium]